MFSLSKMSDCTEEIKQYQHTHELCNKDKRALELHLENVSKECVEFEGKHKVIVQKLQEEKKQLTRELEYKTESLEIANENNQRLSLQVTQCMQQSEKMVLGLYNEMEILQADLRSKNEFITTITEKNATQSQGSTSSSSTKEIDILKNLLQAMTKYREQQDKIRADYQVKLKTWLTAMEDMREDHKNTITEDKKEFQRLQSEIQLRTDAYNKLASEYQKLITPASKIRGGRHSSFKKRKMTRKYRRQRK